LVDQAKGEGDEKIEAKEKAPSFFKMSAAH